MHDTTGSGESLSALAAGDRSLEEQLFVAIDELLQTVAGYGESSTFDPRELRHYDELLRQLAAKAESAALPGLFDISVRLSERVLASTATDPDGVAEIRRVLSAFVLATLDYLADPSSAAFHEALIACVEPLPDGEREILQMIFRSGPACAGAQACDMAVAHDFVAQDWQPPRGQSVSDAGPAQPADEEGGANSLDEAFVGLAGVGEGRAGAYRDVPVYEGVQHVESGVLEFVAREFAVSLAAFSESLRRVGNAASQDERLEIIGACVGELEGLARGADVAGLTALATLLQLLSENLSISADAGQWSGWPDGLYEFPARLLDYLGAPTSAQAAAGLVAVLRDRFWPAAISEVSAAALTNALANVALCDAASVETRASVASADDVSLELPDDINAELLDGILTELPVQTAAFARATRSISEGHGRREDIEVAKRAAHTLKGAANTVGVRGVANLTHHLEDILVALSTHDVLPNLGLSQTLSYAADCLESMSEALTGVGEPPDDAVNVLQDVLNWANRIDAQGIGIAQGDAIQASTETGQAQTPASRRGGQERDQAPVAMLRVPAHFIDELLRLVGETVTTSAQIQNRLSQAVQQARSISDQNALFQKLVAELETLVDMRGITLPGKNLSVAAAGEFDDLELEQYNELQTLSRQLNEVATDVREMGLSEERHLRALNELLEQQDRLHLENQHAVMSARMVPVGSVVPRLQRSVRQACRILDKQVDLRVQGEETVMDGNLLQELVDPLMHMLRNAVDHGIEPEAERVAAGKSAAGHIDLVFRREGDYVTVRCKDDGNGLDLDVVRKLAEDKGFIEPGLALSDDEVARMILIPGFSTRRETTQVSGRGIGMDVVNSKVTAFKGSLMLHSERGTGLTVELRLPVTLLAAHALLVRVRNKIIALSTRGIVDIHYVGPDQIAHVDDRLTYTINNKRYDGHELDALLGLPGARRGNERPGGRAVLIVRLETGAERAVAVEEMLESRSLVIKTLGPYVPKIAGLVGATILGDGNVAPVIDLPDMLYAPSYTRVQAAAYGEGVEASREASMRKALVVDDSVSARRFAAELMRDAGYEVHTAVDGLDAVSFMSQMRPDIVVTDLEMPRMNGFELTRHVRAQESTKAIPVVMITSRATEKHRLQAGLAGVSLYVTKPFNENVLITQIEELTRSASR